MADWAKIALKYGLIVVFTAGIIALLVAVPIPAVSLSQDMINGISFAKTFISYWWPAFDTIMPFVGAVIVFEIGILLFKFSVQAAKWLKMVNE